MTTPAETWIPELTFGARLALVRQRMGWNIKEAAKECGVPAQSWRGWEVGGRAPHNLVTIAMAIATRTGVDVDWLIRGLSPNAMGPNGRYPTNLADLIESPTPAALRPRIIKPRSGDGHPVRHGDGRRTRPGTTRPMTPTYIQKEQSVSRPAMA